MKPLIQEQINTNILYDIVNETENKTLEEEKGNHKGWKKASLNW